MPAPAFQNIAKKTRITGSDTDQQNFGSCSCGKADESEPPVRVFGFSSSGTGKRMFVHGYFMR